MATTSGSTTDNSSADQLKSALATADSKVAQGIQNLQSVHQARLAQANRTVAVLKAQYGADDPRVKTAEAAVAARTTTIRRISICPPPLPAPAAPLTPPRSAPPAPP